MPDERARQIMEQIAPVTKFEEENMRRLTPFQQYLRTGSLVEKKGPRAGRLSKNLLNLMVQHRYDNLVAEGVPENEAERAAKDGTKRFVKLYHTVNTLEDLREKKPSSPDEREIALHKHYLAPLYHEAHAPQYDPDAQKAGLQLLSNLKANNIYKGRMWDKKFVASENTVPELGEENAVNTITSPVGGDANAVDESNWMKLYQELLNKK